MRSSILRLAVVSLVLAALARPAPACDSSSCAILTRGGLGTLAQGAFAVDFSYGYSDEGKRLSGSSSTEDVVLPRIDFDGQGILPGFHREIDGSTNALQADVSYGATARLSAFASLPLFTKKRYVHTHLPGSHTPVEPSDPEDPNDPHGHGPAPEEAPTPLPYASDGLGDTQLGLRWALWGGGAARLPRGRSTCASGRATSRASRPPPTAAVPHGSPNAARASSVPSCAVASRARSHHRARVRCRGARAHRRLRPHARR